MKKSSLLSLLTATAIVATSAGTYAAWDKLDATSTGSITVAKKSVEVTAENMAAFTETNTLGATSVNYAGVAKFNVEDKESKIIGLVAEVEVKDGTTMQVITNGVTASATLQGSYQPGENVFDVTVTVNDETLAGKPLEVTVKATAKTN